jgi:hypothetical protein
MGVIVGGRTLHPSLEGIPTAHVEETHPLGRAGELGGWDGKHAEPLSVPSLLGSPCKSRGLGQAVCGGFGSLGPDIEKAKATPGQAKAETFGPSRAGTNLWLLRTANHQLSMNVDSDSLIRAGVSCR